MLWTSDRGWLSYNAIPEWTIQWISYTQISVTETTPGPLFTKLYNTRFIISFWNLASALSAVVLVKFQCYTTTFTSHHIKHRAYAKELHLFAQTFGMAYKLLVFQICYDTSSNGRRQQHLNGLVQESRNSIANALELRLSCTNPSMCTCISIRFSQNNLWKFHGGCSSSIFLLSNALFSKEQLP